MSFGGLFGGGGSTPKVEPAPTRDTAADDDAANQERIRRAAQAGRQSTMLTGPAGVTTEPTSTRQLS